MNDRAIKSVRILQEYLSGERSLNSQEIFVLRGIVALESEESFFFFARYVLGFDLLTDLTHKKWADDIQRDFFELDKILRLKPRGTYKTSLYGIAFILWLWSCVSRSLKIFYTSANDLLLTEVSEKISSFIDNDDNVFQLVFDLKRDPSANKNTNDIYNIFGRSGQGHSLILRTAGGSTNGIHPNIVIIDDAMDIKDRNSKAIREKKKVWFDLIPPLLFPFENKGKKIKKILVISTRWHMKDLIDYILEKDKRASEGNKWSIEIESIFKNDNEADGSNYPEFITDEDIKAIYEDMDEISFACQYRNLPLPTGLMVFDKKRLHKVKYGELDLSVGKISCFFDPAKGIERGDYPAVIWTHEFNGKVTLIDCIDKKIEIDSLLPTIAKKNKNYNCGFMMFENNGTTLIKETLIRLHTELNYSIELEDFHRGSETSKENRIVSAQPDLYSGFFRFLDVVVQLHPEMWDQVIYYPAYGHDDFPDIIETSISYYRKPKFEFNRYEAV